MVVTGRGEEIVAHEQRKMMRRNYRTQTYNKKKKGREGVQSGEFSQKEVIKNSRLGRKKEDKKKLGRTSM